jgi:hypothetical protein
MRGGHHGELAGRHVAADGLNRDVLVPEDHAGQRFDLDVAHGVPLRLGKVPHLRLREPDVLHLALRDLAHEGFDVGGRQAERRRRVFVEALREIAHGGVAAAFDLLQRRLDGSADLGVVIGRSASGLPRFRCWIMSLFL